MSFSELSLRTKILLLYLLVAFIFVLILPATYFIKNHYQKYALERTVESLYSNFENNVAHEEKAMCVGLNSFAQARGPKEIFRARDRGQLYETTRPLYEHLETNHDITHFYFHDKSGRVFLRVHENEKHGDVIRRHTLRSSMENGEQTAGLELGPLGTFTLRVVKPYFLGDELLGYVELGMKIDHIIEEWNETTRGKLLLLIHEDYFKRHDFFKNHEPFTADSWKQHGPYYERHSTFSADVHSGIERLLDQTELTQSTSFPKELGSLTVNDRNYYFVALPARDAAGERAGLYVLGINTTKKFALLNNIILAVFGLFGLFFITGLGLSFLFSGWLTSPLKQLTAATEELAGGKLAVEVDVESGDELGQLAASFNRMSTELVESKDRLRIMAENIEGTFWMFNSDFTELLFINEKYEEMFGGDCRELQNEPQSFFNYMHPEDHEAVQATMEQLMAGEPATVECRVNPAADYNQWLSITGTPILEEGEVKYIVGFATDITERVEAERKLKESLAEKETLLQEIHHRIKNNMQVLSGLLYLQSQETADEATREKLRATRQRVKTMGLVHEQLYHAEDLANINPEQYIVELLAELAGIYNIPPGKINTNVELVPGEIGINRAIYCGLIVNELVTNALVHGCESEGDPPEVWVNFTSEGDNYSLSVEDDGRGLPDDFSVKESSSLGLQLVKNLTRKQLNGEFEVTSSVEGTKVEVRFPKQSQD